MQNFPTPLLTTIMLSDEPDMVFFSYAWGSEYKPREHQPFVEAVETALENDHGINVWRDQTSLIGGALENMIKNGMQECTFVVIFLTREYAEKLDVDDFTYCRFEFNLMKSFFRPSQVIPIAQDREFQNTLYWRKFSMINHLLHLYRHTIGSSSPDIEAQEAATSIADQISHVKSCWGVDPINDSALRRINQLNFLGLIKAKAKKYVTNTRVWLLSDVQAWVQSNEPGLCVIIGEHGIGKSTFLAALSQIGHLFDLDAAIKYRTRNSERVSQRQSLRISMSLSRSDSGGRYKFCVAAAHFFDSEDIQLRSAKLALLSIAKQLHQLFPEYLKDALAADEALVNAGIEETSLQEIFEKLLVKPFQSTQANTSPRLIVVFDNLYPGIEGFEDLLDILTHRWKEEMPPWLVVIASCDEPNSMLNDQVCLIKPIMPTSESNIKDIENVVSYIFDQQGVVNSERLRRGITEITQMSEGNMARAERLANVHHAANQGLSSEPAEYYQSVLDNFLFQSHCENCENRVNLVCALLVAREPIPFDTVISILHLASEELILAEFPDSIFSWVAAGSSDQALRFYDHWVKQLLLNYINCSEQRGHETLAKACIHGVNVKQNSFCAAHVLFHLKRAEQLKDVETYLLDYQWLKTAIVHLKAPIYGWLEDAFDKPDANTHQSLSEMGNFFRRTARALTYDCRELCTQILHYFKSEHPLIEGAKMENEYSQLKMLEEDYHTMQPLLYSIPNRDSTHEGKITGLVISSKHNTLIAASENGSLVVYSLATGRERKVLADSYDSPLTSLAIHESRFACAVDGNGESLLHVYDIKSLAKQHEWHNNQSRVSSMAMDSTVLLTSSRDDSTWCVRSLDSSTCEHKFPVQGTIFGCGINENSIVVATQEFRILVWNRATLDFSYSLGFSCDEHPRMLSCTSFCVSGKWIFAGTSNGSLVVWHDAEGCIPDVVAKDLPMGRRRKMIHSLACQTMPSGDVWLLSGAADGKARLWEIDSGSQIEEYDEYEQEVWSVALDEQGYVAAGYEDGHILVTKYAFTSVSHNFTRGLSPHNQQRHSGDVCCICLHEELVLSGDKRGNVCMWNSKDGTFVGSLGPPQEGAIKCIVANTDFIVSASLDHSTRIWKRSNKQYAETIIHEPDVIEELYIDDQSGLFALTNKGVVLHVGLKNQHWNISGKIEFSRYEGSPPLGLSQEDCTFPNGWSVSGPHVQRGFEASFSFEANVACYVGAEDHFFCFLQGTGDLHRLQLVRPEEQ